MSYALVFLALSILIFLHEAGHFIAAKFCGIPVARFSLGFGPRLWSFRYRGTDYWLSAVPCGGYVLLGLADEDEWDRPTLAKRLLFYLGGPAANVLAAFIAIAAVLVAQHGLSVTTLVVEPLRQTWAMIAHVCAVVPQLFQQPDQLSGIVGIVAFGGQQVGLSLTALLRFSAFLSSSLAVLNLLPLPPLDGGTMIVITLQRIYRPLGRIRIPLAVAGWCFLMFVMLYATAHDIWRIATGAFA